MGLNLLTMLRLIGVQGTQSSCTTIYWRQLSLQCQLRYVVVVVTIIIIIIKLISYPPSVFFVFLLIPFLLQQTVLRRANRLVTAMHIAANNNYTM